MMNLRQTQQQSFIFGVVYRDEMSHSANLGAILRDGLPANTTFPSRSDYLVLLSYRWAQLSRGIAAVVIVAVPIGFLMVCWVVYFFFEGQILVFPMGTWMIILFIIISWSGCLAY
jgi:hypothetical protein